MSFGKFCTQNLYYESSKQPRVLCDGWELQSLEFEFNESLLTATVTEDL